MNFNEHKGLMDDLYSRPRFPNAVDPWASFFAGSEDEIEYSNWRHLNPKRQEIENRVWNKFLCKGMKILDVGCGKGFFLKRLYDNFADTVEYHGIDISTVAIQHAKKYFKYANYKVAPAEQAPYEDSTFDYIQIISSLEQMLNPQIAINESYRLLKKGGYFYIVIHKESLDPLFCCTCVKILKKFTNIPRKQNASKYTIPLSAARVQIFSAIESLNLKVLETGTLVSHLSIRAYRKIHIPMPFLMLIANLSNNLPFSIFKNLEYRLYRK